MTCGQKGGQAVNIVFSFRVPATTDDDDLITQAHRSGGFLLEW
jgi:hypothetical protein